MDTNQASPTASNPSNGLNSPQVPQRERTDDELENWNPTMEELITLGQSYVHDMKFRRKEQAIQRGFDKIMEDLDRLWNAWQNNSLLVVNTQTQGPTRQPLTVTLTETQIAALTDYWRRNRYGVGQGLGHRVR